uniref:Uncharacterized protein n=1 Tax=Chelydra serpentina TaxID=8475 RepID=A0A8C3TBG4_CHESE
MEPAELDVLGLREQLFHERVRECLVSAWGAARHHGDGLRRGQASPAVHTPPPALLISLGGVLNCSSREGLPCGGSGQPPGADTCVEVSWSAPCQWGPGGARVQVTVLCFDPRCPPRLGFPAPARKGGSNEYLHGMRAAEGFLPLRLFPSLSGGQLTRPRVAGYSSPWSKGTRQPLSRDSRVVAATVI